MSNYHGKNNNNGNTTTAGGKNVECDVCHKTFADEEVQKDHMVESSSVLSATVTLQQKR
jgi:intracellular sulfur oxidation DsrE/DsrF family protein